jgi:hypothetical protein
MLDSQRGVYEGEWRRIVRPFKRSVSESRVDDPELFPVSRVQCRDRSIEKTCSSGPLALAALRNVLCAPLVVKLVQALKLTKQHDEIRCGGCGRRMLIRARLVCGGF